MTEEWCPPEEISANKPPPNNPILGHVIHRLMEIFYPPEPEPPPPVFSPFPFKGCILGKMYSGKSTCLSFLEEGRVFSPTWILILHQPFCAVFRKYIALAKQSNCREGRTKRFQPAAAFQSLSSFQRAPLATDARGCTENFFHVLYELWPLPISRINIL